MKPDQERVQTLLKDTVVLLCKNGLCFSSELKVQGLLGITLDGGDVFLVQIDETLTSQEDGVLLNASSDQMRSCQSDSLNEVVAPYESSSQMVESPRRSLARSRRPKRRSDQPCEVARSAKTSNNDSDIPLDTSHTTAIVVKSEATDSEDSGGVVNPLHLRSINENLSVTQLPKQRRTVRRRTIASCRLIDISIDSGNTQESSFLNFTDQGFGAAIPRDKDALLNLMDLRADQFGIGNAAYADGQEMPQFPNDPRNEGVGIDNAKFVSNKLMIGDAGPDHTKMDQYGGGPGVWSSTDTGGDGGLDRKSFQCEYEGCGLTFYHSYTLYRHQRIKHGRRFGAVDQMSFFCSHPGCGRVFYRELALIKHQRAVHGN